MTSYQHKPLGDSSREIRLINLQPGQESDPIHDTLTHALLDGDAAYDALSYAWGDPQITLPIAIDGLPFQVTVNLESALRHLRLPAEPRVIWIDAICIHQTNIGERDQQVRRMGSVYVNTKNVLVWLGPEADDSNLAMDILGYPFCDKLLGKELLEESQSSLPDEPQNIRRLKAVVKLFSRPWWQRGWVIQEVVEAGRCQENVLLHCGHSQKQWELVFSSVEDIMETVLS
jgi:hypothetical protein